MRPEEKQARIERFERLCRVHGLSLTVQRRVILEAILDREDHPAADQVYEAVRERIPGVSRTTVYRVLETLVRLGLITKVCHPGAAARFDPKTHQHHHLVCLHCGGIVDLEDERLEGITLPEVSTKGFEVQEFHIHFRGICPACRKTLSRAQRAPGGTAKTGRATGSTAKAGPGKSAGPRKKDESKSKGKRRSKKRRRNQP